MQSGIAVSTEGDGWVLLNASPDVPIQIERYLSDPSPETRSSPVSNVLLTNADLDHAVGLLLMREIIGRCKLRLPPRSGGSYLKNFP